MMNEKQGDMEQGRRLGDKLHKLREQMNATEGHRIRLKIKALNTTYRVFVGNFHDLVKALNYFGNLENSMALWAEDNRDKLDEFMAEVGRYFHNFLAGAKTFVDHTRVFKNDMYEGKDFDRVYQT